jgi:hypothetical protein
MKKQMIAALSGLGLLVSTVNCGSVADGADPGRPLATISGKVVGTPQGAAPKHPRLGLIWGTRRENPDDSMRNLFESHPITAAFPADFTFDIFQLPPEETIHRLETPGCPGVVTEIAVGAYIAFDDVNQDGTLQFQSPGSDAAFAYVEGASAAPDLLFGHSTNSYIVYVKSLPNTEYTRQFFHRFDEWTPGFHVVQLCVDVPGTEEPWRFMRVTDPSQMQIVLDPPSTTVDYDIKAMHEHAPFPVCPQE